MAAPGKRKRQEMESFWFSSHSQVPKVNSAFSTAALHRVFSRFSGEKLEILESIGFDGLTKIKQHTRLNRHLALWLLHNFEHYSILCGDGRKISLKDSDVNLVLDIPYGGKEIAFGVLDSDCVDKVTEILGLAPGSPITVDYLEGVISREYGQMMSTEERDAFTVAAVLYADAHFLCPKGNHPKVNKHLFPIMAKPSALGTYNWSAYVLDGLRASGSRVRDALRRCNKTLTIDGCLLLIEIIYLDNLDFGTMLLPYVSIPRVIDFTSERMKVYTEADRDKNCKLSFGATKLKNKADLLYSWSGKEWSGTPCKVQKKHSYFRGTTVQFISTLIEDNKGCYGESMETLSAYLSNRIRVLNQDIGEPGIDEMDSPSSGVESPGLPGEEVMSYHVHDPDLLGPHLILNYDFEIVAKEVKKHSIFGPSPFDIHWENQEPPRHEVQSLFGLLSKMDEAEKDNVWFLHDVPSVISIRAKSLFKQVPSTSDLNHDFIDAAIRMFMQLDDEMCHKTSVKRWRHFLPSFWAIDALRAGELIQSEEIRDMFIGSHLGYNVEDCRMIIAPVLVEWDWHCYVWDFKEKCVSILDPTRIHCPSSTIEHVHMDTVRKLHDDLFDCKNTFFRGWNVSRNGWRRNYVSVEGCGGPSSVSGVHMLFYAQHFNGISLSKKLHNEKAQEYRAELMYRVLKLAGNMGRLPLLA